MKLRIINLGGSIDKTIEIKDFEFRSNTVVNWIRVTQLNGKKETFDNVDVIKLVN